MKRLEKYPFLYETHLHTNQASKCANNSGKEMAKALKEAGYTGMFVTDHNWGGNTCIDSKLPWKDWVHEFCKGYEDAKAWGDANDFQVFFGYEAGYQGTEFLIYGVDESWMASHEEIKDATIEEQYHLIHSAGGMVIHAHPYREEWYIPEIRLYPEFVDGVEAVNATHSSPKSTSHNDPEFDKSAIAYGQKYNLPMTAGSDIHSTSLFGGGVAFSRKIQSVQDYCQAILKGEPHLLTNGLNWYDWRGEYIGCKADEV